MSLLLANNATSFLAAGISNSDTSLTVRTGDGAKFPAPSPGDWFPVTLMNMADGTVEICRATARSGDTFTIERAKEGTTAAAFPSGSLVQLRLTVSALGSSIIEQAALIPNLFWLAQPLGVPIPVFTHLFNNTSDALPPTDNPAFRYIKLTAGDPYNDGALTGESVSGSAPLIDATAVIDYPDSPLHGQTVRLINTERRVLRPGNSGALQDDAIQNITGSFTLRRLQGGGGLSGAAEGVFSLSNGVAVGPLALGTGSEAVHILNFNASNSARTADETRVRNIGADYFMRIY